MSNILGKEIELDIGIKFHQQTRNSDSVPDGVIRQSSFKIVIETKLTDNFTADQLINHLASFDDKNSVQVLLAITKHEPDIKTTKTVVDLIKKKKRNISFAATSFSQIADAVRQNLREHDDDMIEIVDEYVAFCEENALINRRNSTMLALPVGNSFDVNIKYAIYYDPANRNHNIPFRYIGLYLKRSIRGIGEVQKVADADLVKGKLIIHGEINLTEQEQDRIKSTIDETDYYDISEGMRFYLVDKFHEINYEKPTPGSLRGKKYFYFDKKDGFRVDTTTEQLANSINGKKWPTDEEI